ncbi:MULTISPECIES: GlxA family transcriptional regulator [Komagataeibacter]|uniref:HTH-type transcriptional regulator CdhR n=2 Tax=Komagataeibacter saccharivorans TaxID=265959 RepID=A0A347WF95_9PROT|nr:GlxA family transcriptional regulator [Komagataeibacter saccharivorans]MBL7235648.1 GlxA family transcriptional regulator [Novacetimonas hansenii]AXY23538.1 HTH-type transcriptional regulator CdhR [Komagataeibacter saccharivorans]PYD50149.1 AraC family transcriptional regulator [Komagataeibacter saccharivorans]QBL92565.1 HTH-type transcriptional regulator CdhR [Komagataeibacter saccharivorans]GBQ40960.1 AraC family transcriptional regulator [Komagataeibacter saccharivorans NRIC 0614]
MMRFQSDSARPTPRLRVGIILAENFTLSAFSLFVDYLRLAGDKDDNSRPILCNWTIMNSRPDPVRSSCDIPISRHSEFRDPSEFDCIAVVGGLLHGRRQVDDSTLQYLRRAASAGVTLIGLCTGVFVLCRARVMEGRACCLSWYHRQDFMEEFPEHEVVSDRMYLVEGDRITCSGGGGTADMVLYLIEQYLGRQVAKKASHILLLDRPTRSNAPLLQPYPPIIDEINHITDSRIRRAVLEMEQNMNEPVSISRLASYLGISSRQLERLFQTTLGMKPTDFYRLIRLRYARSLLQQGELSVTEIAVETGFSDCAHFSRHFKSMFGQSPSEVRGAKRLVPDGGISFMPERSLTERVGVRLFEEL